MTEQRDSGWFHDLTIPIRDALSHAHCAGSEIQVDVLEHNGMVTSVSWRLISQLGRKTRDIRLNHLQARTLPKEFIETMLWHAVYEVLK